MAVQAVYFGLRAAYKGEGGGICYRQVVDPDFPQRFEHTGKAQDNLVLRRPARQERTVKNHIVAHLVYGERQAVPVHDFAAHSTNLPCSDSTVIKHLAVSGGVNDLYLQQLPDKYPAYHKRQKHYYPSPYSNTYAHFPVPFQTLKI
jgi:hypothetical protein